MANNNAPMGFRPVGHLTGGEIRANQYILTTGATVFPGDVLKVVAGGTVERAAAADALICVGVAAEYKSDSGSAGGVTVLVHDDPYIIYSIQSATAAAVDVFATADHVATAGDATTKQSRESLAAVTDAQFKIIGLDTRDPNNAWGAYAKVLCIFNEHLYKAAVAGV